MVQQIQAILFNLVIGQEIGTAPVAMVSTAIGVFVIENGRG